MKNATIGMLAACILAATFTMARAAEDVPEPTEVRLYPMNYFLENLPERSIPAMYWILSASPSPEIRQHICFPQNSRGSTTMVGELIRNRIEPDSWDAARNTSLEERGGQLVIVQTPRVHELIVKKLHEFSRDMMTQFSVQSVWIEIPADQLLPYLGKSGQVVEDAALKQALKQGKLLATPATTVFNQQTVGLMNGTLKTYLANCDCSGDVLEPMIHTLLEGNVLQVQPNYSFDGNSVDLALTVARNENLRRENVSPALYTKAPQLAQPENIKLEKLPLAAEKEAQAPIQMPVQHVSVDSSTLKGNMSCPLGKWVQAGLLSDPSGKNQGRNVLIFIQINRVVNGQIDNTPLVITPHGSTPAKVKTP